MSDNCLDKPCIVCGKIIHGANYYCQKCKACVCFYCGADVLKQVEADKLRCPRCGAELK
jgi:hypothetical protein